MSLASISRVFRRRVGGAMLMLGLAGLVISLIGRATWQADLDPVVIPASTTSTTTTTTSTNAPTSTTTSPAAPSTAAPTTTPAPEAESVGDFVAVLASAMAATDVDTLTSRLHPEVLARYGDDQCRAYVATQGDPSFGLELINATDPGVWSYSTDDLSSDVPDTFTATVDQVRSGETTRRDIHFAYFEGEIRWFSDCGTPVS